jgi:hypothetical protein
MDLPASITLGQRADGKPVVYVVEVPRSYAARYDLDAAWQTSHHRAAAAAAALCCPRLARDLKVTYAGDALAFGGRVIDAYAVLIEEHGIDATPRLLIAQGTMLAVELILSSRESVPDESEVAAVVDFTAPPPEPST